MQRLGSQVIACNFPTRLLAYFLASGLIGAVATALPAQEPAEPPRDALDRGTPFSSARGFLLAAGAQDYETAAKFLDLRNLPQGVAAAGGPELARQLDFILSKSVDVEDYALDDTPSGRQGDDLPEFRDLLASIPGPQGTVDLYMQHVPRSDGVLIWKVSNQSVAVLPQLYAHYANPAWVEFVRTRLPQYGGFLGVEWYKWVIAIGIGLLAWPVFHLIAVLLSRILVSRDNPLFSLVRRMLTRPLTALAVILLIAVVLHRLGLGAVAQKYADAKTLIIAVVVWFVWSLIGLYQKYKSARLTEQGREGAARLTRPIANLTRLLVLLAGLLFWLSNMGVNISTVLAGLGVGGLALALALQKPLEDLMGALTLFSQQPVRVGDFCKYGNVTGVVEEIGLRSTRIRTLSNTVVCVPNSLIAHSKIENYTAREKYHYQPVLRLSYTSSPEQIRNIIEGIRSMLEAHPRVLKDVVRVRFTDFRDDAILVKVHSYVNSTDVSEYSEIAEELNLKIMEIVEGHSAAFALPSRMVYGSGEVAA